MKKKFLAATLVIAGALMLPTLAAQDTSGMRYTSASEGFYASLRAQFNSGGSDDAGFAIENSTSRFGVRGTNDLGGGLEGFYQYEAGVGLDNGSGLSTRLGHVGVRGGFGQLQVGTFWPQSYNWVHGSTDVANWASGHFVYTTLLPGRQSRALEYTTPDLNGFQAAAFIEMDSSRDGEGAVGPASPGETPASFSDTLYDNDAISLAVANGERHRYLVAESNNGGSPAVVLHTSPPQPIFDENGAPTPFRLSIPDTLSATVSSFNARLGTGSIDSPFYYYDVADNGAYQDGDEPVIFGVRTFTDARPFTPANPKDDNDIDLWSLSAKYSVLGFDTGISYTAAPDGLAKSSGSRDDLSLYALRLGYAQDNWYVSGWYAEDNAGDDTNREHDTETFSLAAGIAVGKTNLYAVYEQQESDNYKPGTLTSAAVDSTGSDDDESATIGMQYNLGARSRLWIEYVNRDYNSNPDADDYTTIGLRHDL